MCPPLPSYHLTQTDAGCNSICVSTILCHSAGKFKATDLIVFLTEQAGSTAAGNANDSEESEGSNSQQEKKEEKQDPQIVRDLNMTQYEGLTDEEDAWLVGFYSGVAHVIPLQSHNSDMHEAVLVHHGQKQVSWGTVQMYKLSSFVCRYTSMQHFIPCS